MQEVFRMFSNQELISQLRWYANQYENGKSLGRVIAHTSTIMKAAADMIEYQNQVINRPSELVKNAKEEVRCTSSD